MSAQAEKQTSKVDKPTPMMAQFLKVKEQYPDCMLFYRMGDFYELFLDDAVVAAEALDITLTKRGRHNGDDIPMCGVPVHSHESYLTRLIKQGFKVAICEQIETPAEAKKRDGYKALVRRDVIRVITQGTLTEDNLLDKGAHNYLAALTDIAGSIGLSWVELSTGEFTLQPISITDLGAALERLNAGEILVSEKMVQNEKLFDLFAEYKHKLTIQPNSRFDSENARKRMEQQFGVGTLDAFGGFSRAEIASAGALLDYIELTQKGKFPRLSPPKQLALGAVMEIDAATRRNLELTHTLNGERKGSLLHTLDNTVTGAGARLLSNDLSMPLTDPDVINQRLDLIQYFIEDRNIRDSIRDFLRQSADVERALARLSLGRGGPRDLAAIKNTLSQTLALNELLQNDVSKPSMPVLLKEILDKTKIWGTHHPLIDQLNRALSDELPAFARDGGFIKKAYSPHLDELRVLRDQSRQLIAGLQENYTKISGVSNLKIKHNNVLGYFIEVTLNNSDALMAQSDKAHEDNIFIHRQTLANCTRFSTVELSDLERKISEAAEKSIALEQELFAHLLEETLLKGQEIADTAQALARLDVSSSLAEIAEQRNYARPHIDQSTSFDITSGRHPVVERALKKNEDKDFIANNCSLSDGQKLWLLTGPNMAGKSTFLRQNALIALMAQMGGYVPADKAHIGIIDRVFSRVGAADDLARGRSTFMVEMVETAAILNQATDHSLVILDEIGRGTATFDGLSIAWACVEHLQGQNKCRALFATHYHELTSLANKLDHVSCHTMRVKEWKGDVIFMHEVTDGAADRSYGIHVAKLAGLPPAVIKRAEQVLHTLEKSEQSGTLSNLADDLPLFHVMLEDTEETAQLSSELESLLREINPDELTPREALDALYKLKEQLDLESREPQT